MASWEKGLLLTAGLLLPGPAFCSGTPANSPEVRALLERVDRLYRSERSRARIEMEVVTPDWRRKLSMDFWTEGLDKTFIRVLSPAREAGAATLRKGNEMWNYFPKINKVNKTRGAAAKF